MRICCKPVLAVTGAAEYDSYKIIIPVDSNHPYFLLVEYLYRKASVV